MLGEVASSLLVLAFLEELLLFLAVFFAGFLVVFFVAFLVVFFAPCPLRGGLVSQSGSIHIFHGPSGVHDDPRRAARLADFVGRLDLAVLRKRERDRMLLGVVVDAAHIAAPTGE